MTPSIDSLPILHAGHPLWYRGRLVGVAVDGEVYTVGWVEPSERQVVRAIGLAALEAPHFTPDQQLGFAAYYLLPPERWRTLRALPDELIARMAGLPLDLVARRRQLPELGVGDDEVDEEIACA